MPLDLSIPVDKEVYEIVEGFSSGVEAKNFLCSAILYYARSPLVLSANALTDSLSKVDLTGKFDQVFLLLNKIYTQLNATFTCVNTEGVSGGVVAGIPSQSISLKEQNNIHPTAPPFLNKDTLETLNSLKSKFKI